MQLLRFKFLTYLGLKKPEVTFSDKYMNNDFDLIKSMQIADYKFIFLKL